MSQQSALEAPYELRLRCLRVRQPIGDFYIAAIRSTDLCQITLADVRRMYREREIETYLGIQRPLSSKRVKEIAQYVTTVDACFPTSVILAVGAASAEFDEMANELILKSDLDADNAEDRITSIKIARVLDGQHRIEGLRNYSGPPFEVNVSIFIDMDIESQAYLFSTVNLAQTKVNRSLVYDLFDYAKARSPQKTCHNLAVALDTLESSPFFHRIKRLGASTHGRFNETLTQATFVEALLPYLSSNKIEDRDLYMRGKQPPRQSERDKQQIFRALFLNEKDMEIGDILLNYFSAVRDRWPDAWSSQEEGIMLGKTNGFRAFMRLLRPIYLKLATASAAVPSKAAFERLFATVTLKDPDFNVEAFKPGTSGESALFQRLREELNLL